MIKKVAFIAQPTKDIAKAREFYGDVLGLKQTNDYGDFWSEYDTPDGKSVALDTFSAKMEGTHTYLALETDDISAEIARLKELGVNVAKDVWVNKGHDGGEVCKMAMISDPDGNPIMLHEIAKNRVVGDCD